MDIEQALLQSLEPILLDVVKLEKRVEDIQREQKPIPAADVINALKGDFDFLNAVAGKNGVGISAIEATKDARAVVVALDDGRTFTIELPQGEPGKAGKDASAADVAEVLKGDIHFLDAVKPDNGAQGVGIKSVESEPDNSAILITLDNGEHYHVDLPQGEPGKDANALDVAIALYNDDDFIERVKGEQGAPGRPGQSGVSIKSFAQSADKKSVLITLTDDTKHELILPEPPPGERGEPGRDGLGVDVPQWEKGIYRAGTFVTSALGKVYEATKDTNGKPGISADWRRVGCYGFEFKGVKNDKAEYEIGDLVIDGGSLFLHNGRDFKMVVQRGKDGRRGLNGKDAPNIIGGALTEKGLSVAFDSGDVQTWNVPILETLNKLIERTEELITQATEQLEELKKLNEPKPKRARAKRNV